MRRILPILILTLIYLVCSSRSCTDDDQPGHLSQQEKIGALRDSIAQQFNKEQLEDAELRIFEKTAIQKLTEWADYLKIATDTSLAATFREKAGKMASNLFLTESDAERAENYWYSKGYVIPDSIRIGNPLSASNDNTYTGLLTFCRKPSISGFAGKNKDIESILISVIRSPKVFGSDTLLVWDVYLGAAK